MVARSSKVLTLGEWHRRMVYQNLAQEYPQGARDQVYRLAGSVRSMHNGEDDEEGFPHYRYGANRVRVDCSRCRMRSHVRELSVWCKVLPSPQG